MKVLNEIKEISNLEELEGYIKGLFIQDKYDRYIPAIINEGIYTVESGESFYLKLVLAHHKVEYKTTWLKRNLEFGLKDPDFRFNENESIYNLFVENVITRRKVKGNYLYQINPNIVGDEIEEYQYDNNIIVNAFYNNEYSNIKGKPVLKIENEKNILMIKDVLLPYLYDVHGNVSPKYKLVAEYEYRTHNNHFTKLTTGILKTSKGIHDVNVNNKSVSIIGSIDVDLIDDGFNIESRDIKVIDLATNEGRRHNPNNFNDDTDAGLVVFDKDVINIIDNYYYVYDLMIYDKINIDNYYLIDILDDYVVFWEGEYNKLPEIIKDEIDSYNILPDKQKGIISPGMFAWQLGADWNYYKKLYPEQLLAMKVKETSFNKAIEIGMTFLIPKNLLVFKHFIEKMEEITDIRLSIFNSKLEDVQLLNKIASGEFVEIAYDELKLLFRKYCYGIYRVMEDE